MSDPDSDNDESSTFDPTYLNLEPEIEFGQESGDSIDMKDIKVERTESVDEWKENEVTFAEPCVEQKTQIAKTEQSKPSKCTLTENQSKLKSSSGQAAKSRKIKPEKVVSDQDRRFICDICNKSFRLKHHLKLVVINLEIATSFDAIAINIIPPNLLTFSERIWPRIPTKKITCVKYAANNSSKAAISCCTCECIRVNATIHVRFVKSDSSIHRICDGTFKHIANNFHLFAVAACVVLPIKMQRSCMKPNVRWNY